jgi:hypothetical protein
LYRILHEEPDLSGVPGTLRPLLQAALAKNPTTLPTAHDLLSELTGRRDEPAPTAPYAAETALNRTWQLRPGLRAGPQPPRPKRVPVIAATAALILAAGAAAGLSVFGHSETAPRSAHETANTRTVRGADLNLAEAVAFLNKRGYQTGDAMWDSSDTLNAVDGPFYTFFFADGAYIGTDTHGRQRQSRLCHQEHGRHDHRHLPALQNDGSPMVPHRRR